MKLIIKPTDLIERFIWDKYVYFCLDGKNTLQLEKIITDNNEFEISEKDAFVIGLINVIYTDDVIYKLKQFLLETIANKSFDFEDEFDKKKKSFISQQVLIYSINTFKNKLPKNYKSIDQTFNNGVLDLDEKYIEFIEGVETLITNQIKEYECVKCAQVKKIINKL